MDYATNEIVNQFESSNAVIDHIDNNFVYYADGTISTIEQYRQAFDSWVDSESYLNNYSNLGSEASGYTDSSDAGSVINNASSTVTNKFAFYQNVSSNVNDMVNTITNIESLPSFSINVNSKYYSGTVKVIDLSWYAPYKEYGDTIICIFSYLGFLWSIFIRLPDIISGAGANYSSMSSLEKNYNNFMSKKGN